MDYSQAASLLESAFTEAEAIALQDATVESTDQKIKTALDRLFVSRTQAFREALVGCALAKHFDATIDVTKPYVKHGPHAYNARSLDEAVVNPALRARRIPCSGGPFLSVLRRGVRFNESMRTGARDQQAFDAFLTIVDSINAATPGQAKGFLLELAYRFLDLRRAADIPLSRLQRISLEQYGILVAGLLDTPSGGRFPVFLLEAIFGAIRAVFELDWTVEVQGINVADDASGAGGDIVIRRGERVVLAAEVTERPVSANRVRTTFVSKISPNGIEDYLFFVTSGVDEDAVKQARQYFSQGHEVNFAEVRNYILTMLTTTGVAGRQEFNRILSDRLSRDDVPATLKVAWNELIARLTTA